jgi:hypothetical protein
MGFEDTDRRFISAEGYRLVQIQRAKHYRVWTDGSVVFECGDNDGLPILDNGDYLAGKEF